jgi:hypothetical protein
MFLATPPIPSIWYISNTGFYWVNKSVRRPTESDTRQRAEPYDKRLAEIHWPLYLLLKPLISVHIYSQYMGCSRKRLSIIIWLSYDWFHKLKPIVPYKQLLKFIMFCHLHFGKFSTLHLNPCWQHTSLASYLVENVLINFLDDIGHVILGDLKIFTWFNW